MAIAQENGSPIQEGLTYLQLGKLYTELSQLTLAERALEKGTAKFSEINNMHLLKRS